MAKTKIDFKSLDIPSAALTPLYAYVGAGDLAVTAFKEYLADVQGYVADVQKAFADYQKDVETRVAVLASEGGQIRAGSLLAHGPEPSPRGPTEGQMPVPRDVRSPSWA